MGEKSTYFIMAPLRFELMMFSFNYYMIQIVLLRADVKML